MNTELLAWVSAFGIPLLGLMLARQDRHRLEMHEQSTRIEDKVGHIDDCLDELKVEVAGNTVTKRDLAAREASLLDAMERQRAAFDRNTDGLHKRIFRLEDAAFEKVSK